jgi:hypothetical protein
MALHKPIRLAWRECNVSCSVAFPCALLVTFRTFIIHLLTIWLPGSNIQLLPYSFDQVFTYYDALNRWTTPESPKGHDRTKKLLFSQDPGGFAFPRLLDTCPLDTTVVTKWKWQNQVNTDNDNTSKFTCFIYKYRKLSPKILGLKTVLLNWEDTAVIVQTFFLKFLKSCSKISFSDTLSPLQWQTPNVYSNIPPKITEKTTEDYDRLLCIPRWMWEW